MLFQENQYSHVQTVSFANTTFSLAAIDSDNDGYGICYSFLETQTKADEGGEVQDKSNGREEATPDQSWTNPASLAFPTQVRPVGMALMTEPVFDSTTGAPSTSQVLALNVGFTVVVDQGNLWIFRTARDCRSYLADRFVFDTNSRSLEKAGEVRFVHSGHADLPANDSDRYGNADPIGDAFPEPTFRLRLDQTIDAQPAAVILVPDSTKSNSAVWQIFAPHDNIINRYEIPYSSRAWFDLAGVDDAVNDSLELCSVGQIASEGQNLSCPTAILYEQQEMALTSVGEPQVVQKAIRAMMVALSAPSDGDLHHPQLAVVDMGISPKGQLPRFDAPIAYQPVGAFKTAVSLDGRGDAITLVSDHNVTIPLSCFFFSSWVRWKGPNTAKTAQIVVAMSSSRIGFKLSIDVDGFIRFERTGGPSVTSPVALVPGQWSNIAVSVFSDILGRPGGAILYVNGVLAASKDDAFINVSGYESFAIDLGRSPANSDGTGPWQDFFYGEFGQFYLSDAFEDDGPYLHADWMYAAEAGDLRTSVQIFWAFNEGGGTTLANVVEGDHSDTASDGATGSEYFVGQLVGATWVPVVCPVPSTMPTSFVDSNFLDASTILLTPNQLPLTPATGQRPSLMKADDGHVHLYYQDTNNHACALHMTTEAQRARVTLMQVVASNEATDTELCPVAILVARHTGLLWGRMRVTLGAINGDVFSTVVFASTDHPHLDEQWENVPTRLDLFEQVINGTAAQTAEQSGVINDQEVAAAHGQVSYDYVNNFTCFDPVTGDQVTLTGPRPSQLFEVVVPQQILEQTPVISLGESSDILLSETVGNDTGWIRGTLEPALRLLGQRGVSGFSPGAPALDIDGDLTVQVWVQRQADDKGNVLTYAGAATDYALTLDEDGRVTAERTGFDASIMTGISRSTIDALPLDEWRHVAAIYNASYAVHLQPGVYLKSSYSSDFDLETGFTLETWVKFDTEVFGNYETILSRKSYVEGESSFELRAMNTDSDEHTRQLRLDLFQDGQEVHINGNLSAPANTWVHLAATYHSDSGYNYLEMQNSDDNCIKLKQPTQEALSTFTVEFNFRPRNADKKSFVSYDRRDDGGTAETRNYFQVGYLSSSSSNQHLAVEIEDVEVQISRSSWDPSNDDWYRLSVVVSTEEDDASYVTVYVDGKIAQRADDGALAERIRFEQRLQPGGSDGTDTTDDFHPWTIGAEWDEDGRGDYADMDIREFRLWSTARTQSQILTTLGTEAFADTLGLVRHVVFDADAGSESHMVIDQISAESFEINTNGDNDKVTWHYRPVAAKAMLYANGQAIGGMGVIGPNNTVTKSSTPLTMGQRAVCEPGGDNNQLLGSLDEVRIWDMPRLSSQLSYFSQNKLEHLEEQPGLVAYWRFDKAVGASVDDAVSGHVATIKGIEFARLSDSQALWEPSIFGADWTLYFNGVVANMTGRRVLSILPDDPAPDTGLYVGSNTSNSKRIKACLSELQIWDQARDEVTIYSTMGQPQAPEDSLQGYYRFNDGSGGRATDLSGNAQDLILSYRNSHGTFSDAWAFYDDGNGTVEQPVPVRDEALTVINGTNGYAYPDASKTVIIGAPSVVDDSVNGVRIYTWNSTGGQAPAGWTFEDDIPLAGTEAIYMGQIQYEPQLVGYIEGAPPVPSENLTIDAPSNPDRYFNNSSTEVTLTSGTSENVSFAFGGGLGLGLDKSGGLKFQGNMKSDQSLYAGTPVAGTEQGASTDIFNAEINASITESDKLSGSLKKAQGGSVRVANSKTYGVALDGGWENNCYQISGDIENPYHVAGKRLYRPNSMGSAIVKSRTADLFAIRSKKTKAMIGYQMSLNPEIPEDINIINFKLNPLYTRNGTLDGYVGFDKDQYYKDLSLGKKGSYFKPEQAYRLKHTMERSAQQTLADTSRSSDEAKGAGQARDLGLANTYVWTADAGSYSEEHTNASTYTEKFSGGGSTQMGLEAQVNASVGFGWGVLTGATTSGTLGGNLDINLQYTHNEATSHAMGLTSNVACEGFLNRVANFRDFDLIAVDTQDVKDTLDSGKIPIDPNDEVYAAFHEYGIDLTSMNHVESSQDGLWTVTDLTVVYYVSNDQADPTLFRFNYAETGTANSQYNVNYDYAAPNCPGKVRGYRYMSLFVPADKENFDSFFATGADQIIDPDWLASSDPDAVALRQARNRPNGAWRVLHRVTYVNRMPPQPDEWSGAPPQTEVVAASPVRPDAHSIHHNATLIKLVWDALFPEADHSQEYKLDFHDLSLDSLNLDAVTATVNTVLDQLGVTEAERRKAYIAMTVTFFELLFMPNEKQEA